MGFIAHADCLVCFEVAVASCLHAVAVASGRFLPDAARFFCGIVDVVVALVIPPGGKKKKGGAQRPVRVRFELLL